MDNDLRNKVAVVTGAAQGIGLAIAEYLHALDAEVVLVDRNRKRLEAATNKIAAAGGAPAHAIVADLAAPAEIDALAQQLSKTVTHIDILVNNAGIESDASFDWVTAELFDRIMAVNVRAPLLLTQALAPMFAQGAGAVINIGSVHAEYAFFNAIPYACSKAALVALTRNLALELASRGIRVNAICPGYIDTPMWEEWLRTTDHPEAVARQTAELHPLGRRGTPDDVVAAVGYLAAPGSSWVTGTCLVVDGGLTIRVHP